MGKCCWEKEKKMKKKKPKQTKKALPERPMTSSPTDLLSQIMPYLERGKENKARTAEW